MNVEGTRMDDLKKMPVVTLPTEDKLREIAVARHERTGWCNLDLLPSEVMELSAPTKFVEIPLNLTRLWDGNESEFNTMREALEPIFDQTQPYFFKFSSRSPKETHNELSGIQTWCAAQAVDRIVLSERCLDDYTLYSRHPTYKLKACAREWQWGVTEQAELRCFVKDHKLLCAAQYVELTSDWLRGTWEDTVGIWQSTVKFWEMLHPRLSQPDYVFDVYVNRLDRPLEKPLIEINPYGPSDPCALKSYEAIENAAPGVYCYSATTR